MAFYKLTELLSLFSTSPRTFTSSCHFTDGFSPGWMRNYVFFFDVCTCAYQGRARLRKASCLFPSCHCLTPDGENGLFFSTEKSVLQDQKTFIFGPCATSDSFCPTVFVHLRLHLSKTSEYFSHHCRRVYLCLRNGAFLRSFLGTGHAEGL